MKFINKITSQDATLKKLNYQGERKVINFLIAYFSKSVLKHHHCGGRRKLMLVPVSVNPLNKAAEDHDSCKCVVLGLKKRVFHHVVLQNGNPVLVMGSRKQSICFPLLNSTCIFRGCITNSSNETMQSCCVLLCQVELRGRLRHCRQFLTAVSLCDVQADIELYDEQRSILVRDATGIPSTAYQQLPCSPSHCASQNALEAHAGSMRIQLNI